MFAVLSQKLLVLNGVNNFINDRHKLGTSADGQLSSQLYKLK